MLVLMGLNFMVSTPDHVHRRHHHGPARGPQPVLARLGLGPPAARRGRLHRGPPDAAVPRHAERRSTASTACCASRSSASAWSGPSCGNRHETERFGQANTVLTDISVKIGALFVLMFPVISMVLHLATAAVLWFGGQRVDAGDMQVGALTAFLQYLLQILMAVMMGTFMAMMIPRAVVCADRIGEVLDVEPSIHDPAAPGHPRAARAWWSTATSRFAYPGAEAPVLSDISFTAEPGETAIIGSTGVRQDDAGVPAPAPLRRRRRRSPARRGARHASWTGRSSPSAWGSCRSGPTCSPAPSRTTFASASRTPPTTNCGTRCSRPGRQTSSGRSKAGLGSRIAQGGTNVSGGQRQRLCIARALVARPRSTCSTTRSPRSTCHRRPAAGSAQRNTADATVIIVAQRVSTITEADQILVLDDGRIVDRGTHEELLETSPTYQEIVESQLSVEEVA